MNSLLLPLSYTDDPGRSKTCSLAHSILAFPYELRLSGFPPGVAWMRQHPTVCTCGGSSVTLEFQRLILSP